MLVIIVIISCIKLDYNIILCVCICVSASIVQLLSSIVIVHILSVYLIKKNIPHGGSVGMASTITLSPPPSFDFKRPDEWT